MKTKNGKWNCLLCLGVVLLFLVGSPLEIYADDTKESDTVLAKASESSKEKNTEILSAGAAVLLDVDVTLEEEQIAALVKDKTEQTTAVKALEQTQKNTTLVMAKVNQYVNIRMEPSQESEKAGVLYKDCGGDIIERKDGWTKISSGDVTGWVKDEYLYFGDEAESLAKEVGILIAYAQTETLRVRKEPSLDAGVLGLLAMNEAVEAMQQDGDWWSVSYEGTTGYVSAEYVKVEFDIDTAESIEEIKAREAAEAEAKRKQQKEAIMTTASEMDILAALIQCEAGGESYEGQIAVGAVVMNRVRSGAYPNTIAEVIYASGQFTPASSSKMSSLILNGNIKESCRQAAQEVVNGACNVGNATHFRRVGNKDGLIIGNHVFW